jgi:predicted nucleic acid-binding protein
MNLFIDTNIYLTFYHFSSDDLEELRKLLVAIKNHKIVLYVPEQATKEFRRNREVKIADALKMLGEQKLPKSFPQFCKDYKEYSELRDAIDKYEQGKNKLMQNLLHDIKNKNLGADKLIADLFGEAKIIETTEDILVKAKRRFDLGNPPGKNKSYGDAVNWESLIASAPNRKDFHLITDDRDYISQIDSNCLSEFLFEEWQEEKKSEIFFYKTLSAFFQQHFPDIKLATQLEKEFAIASLVNSGTFANTHAAIAKLLRYTDLSNSEINEIIESSISNNQIYKIREDEDVLDYLTSLIRGKEDIIEPGTLNEFNELYHPQPKSVEARESPPDF